MAFLLYHLFAFFSLFSYGLYHLVSATLAHLKPPSPSSSSSASSPAPPYFARPFYPLPLPGPADRHPNLRLVPLHLALLSLLLSSAFLSFSPSPSRLLSLQSSAALLLFLVLAASLLLLPPHLSLPPDLTFLLSSLAFALLSSASSHSSSSYPASDLQAKCDALSSRISAASSAAALALALFPRLFLAELALAASVALHGLWSLQAGLSLYVEGFIPEGCHRLLERSATRCDVEDYWVRAAALLDLAFVLHTTFIAVVAVTVYLVVARASGGTAGGLSRRHNGGSYESLPTSSSSAALADLDHVQLKALSKSTAQA